MSYNNHWSGRRPVKKKKITFAEKMSALKMSSAIFKKLVTSEFSKNADVPIGDLLYALNEVDLGNLDNKFRDFLSEQITSMIQRDILAAQKGSGKLNKKHFEIMRLGNEIFNKSEKDKLKFQLQNCYKYFHAYARTPMVGLIANWLDSNVTGDADIARNMFEQNYRVIDASAADKLISLLPANDKALEKLAAKSPRLMIRKFKKMDLSKVENRKKLINWLADAPSRLNKIDFKITISASDLKLLSPMKRLGIMKLLYEPYMGIAYEATDRCDADDICHFPIGLESRIATSPWTKWTKYISVSLPDRDTFKELVFAASIKDNDSVTRWYESAKYLYDFIEELKDRMNEMKLIFSIE